MTLAWPESLFCVAFSSSKLVCTVPTSDVPIAAPFHLITFETRRVSRFGSLVGCVVVALWVFGLCGSSLWFRVCFVWVLLGLFWVCLDLQFPAVLCIAFLVYQVHLSAI